MWKKIHFSKFNFRTFAIQAIQTKNAPVGIL